MKNLRYSTVHVYMLGVCMRVGALCKDITSEPVFLNVYEAQESISGNEFRQSM